MTIDDFEPGSEVQILVDGSPVWCRLMHRFDRGGWVRRFIAEDRIDESEAGLMVVPGDLLVADSRRVAKTKTRKKRR